MNQEMVLKKQNGFEGFICIHCCYVARYLARWYGARQLIPTNIPETPTQERKIRASDSYQIPLRILCKIVPYKVICSSEFYTYK